MSHERLKELCRGACFELNIAKLEEKAESVMINFDGVNISLVFDGQFETEKICCFADLGPVAEQSRSDIYARLLELNLLTGAKSNGVFALDAASGHAILSIHLYLSPQFETRQFAEVLRTLALQTHTLRDDVLGVGSMSGAGAPLVEERL